MPSQANQVPAEVILGQFGQDPYYQPTGGSQPAQPPNIRPSFQYLVAFQDVPTTDPTTFTVAPVGTTGSAGQWTDITQFVASHQITRGRQHELQQFEAGTCSLVLNGWDGRFNPLNTAGPYYGFLVPRKWLQVRTIWNGTTYLRFTGHVDAWPVEWPDPYTQWSTVHATDPLRMFNLNNVTSSGYATTVEADSPAGYWRLGDPVGSIKALDSSGNGLTGFNSTAAPGGITFGESPALLADPNTSMLAGVGGGSPLYGTLAFPTPTGVSNVSTCSIECWLKTPTAAAPVGTTLCIGDNTHFAAINLDGTNGLSSVNSSVGGSGSWRQSTVVPDDSNWHYVVCSWTSGTPTFYVDGVNTTTFGTATVAGNQFMSNISANGDTLFQDLAFYNYALTATQVANHYAAGAFPQQSTDARINRILNIVGWSATARNIDQGHSTVQAVTSDLTTTSSLSHMQQVEATEGGALFIGTDGRVNFRSRTSLFSNPLFTRSQVTIGDRFQTNDLPFDPGPNIAIDDLDLYNEAVATRQNGNTQRATNATSIANNGRATWQPPAQLLGISDSEVLSLCQYVVFKFNTPIVRTRSVTVDLFNLIQPNLVGTLLGLDLLQKISLERVWFPGGGPGEYSYDSPVDFDSGVGFDGATANFSQSFNIERIDEQSSPDQYKVTFAVAISDPPFWVLGQSRLGIDTTLSW